MGERAFVIMQVGAKDSPERKRADEIYGFIIAPAVRDAGLEPYRADLDLSPGAITPRMLSVLLEARVVIADLTGRNPNVFYELGITHSFARPLISIADSSSSLPFDAKDERVIELGEYSTVGLTYAQGEEAKASLQESLRIVLSADYLPPSPLREVAANRSVDQLAPENPLAAEMTMIRETLQEIHEVIIFPDSAIPEDVRQENRLLRLVIEKHLDTLDENDIDMLSIGKLGSQQSWGYDLKKLWREKMRAIKDAGITGMEAYKRQMAEDVESNDHSDEPPF